MQRANGGLFFAMVFALTLAADAGATESGPPHQPVGNVIRKSSHIDFIAREIVTEDGDQFAVEEGILWVPENRLATGSREIPVPFIRVPAKHPSGEPRIYLKGGPGGFFLLTDGKTYSGVADTTTVIVSAWGKSEIKAARGAHDLIFLNQRGNSRTSPSSGLAYRVPQIDPGAKSATAATVQAEANAIKDAQDRLAGHGYDLRGYDILHVVDDIEAIRTAFHYDKITLIGGSFGSQTALAYARRYPDNVDRMLLRGIEPLDYSYDSSAGLDAAIRRLLQRADNAPELRELVPIGGYFAALERAKRKLNESPIAVRIEGEVEPVTVSGDDIVSTVLELEFSPCPTNSLRSRLVFLPAFINELEKGDYRFLALIASRSRKPRVEPLIKYLIDNSLGITSLRDDEIKGEVRGSFVGDPNLLYRATRDNSVTPTVSDQFRTFSRTDIPVMLLQGDTDFSTPIENTEELYPWLERGNLIRVQGGTHDVLTEVQLELPEVFALTREFLDADRDHLVRRDMTVSLPIHPFESPAANGLYDTALRCRR